MSATHHAIETTAVIIIIIIIIDFLIVSEACKGVFSNRVRALESFHSPQTGLSATAGEGRQASGAPQRGK